MARRQANLGVSWDTPFVDGLTLDSRWIYTGSAYVDSANALAVPHWNRVDLGAAYAFQVARQAAGGARQPGERTGQGLLDRSQRLPVDQLAAHPFPFPHGGLLSPPHHNQKPPMTSQ